MCWHIEDQWRVERGMDMYTVLYQKGGKSEERLKGQCHRKIFYSYVFVEKIHLGPCEYQIIIFSKTVSTSRRYSNSARKLGYQ